MTAVQPAIDIITSADLSPTEHLLLKHFVQGALEPERAADYLVSRIQFSTCSVEVALREFKQHWRGLVSTVTVDGPIPPNARELVVQRDGRDFAMRRNPSHVPWSTVEPVHVLPPLSLHRLTEDNMRPLLEAFLSSDVVATLTRLLHEPADSETYLKNVLLLPPSIHKAFRAGHVDIRPRLDIRDLPYPRDDDSLEHCVYGLCTQWPCEEVTGLYLGDGSRFSGALHFFKLSTTDTRKLPLPSSFLLNIHFRFATALHMFYIEDKVARGWPSKSMGITLPKAVISGFFSLWRLLPTRLRAFCYSLLNMLGRRLYPLEANVWAQRLPSGLYMKQCTRSPRNEPNVLKLLEKHTTIPAPRLLDTWSANGVTNLLMTRMPGQTLGSVAHLLSYAERDVLAADIRDTLAQLRSIPNTTPYLIADTLGGAITDHRIPDDTGGPFKTEAGFNDHLTSHLSISFEQIVRDNRLPYREHKLFPLTHSDFHHSNILLEQGRLSGIVDWESAGFKPEYWEFTKAMYCLPPGSVLGEIWRGVWGTQYEEELGIERRLWRVTPFGV